MWLELVFYGLVSGILFYLFYKWATVNENYFAKRHMKHLTPRFLVGNTFGLFTRRYVPTDFFNSIYYRFPNEKIIGFFDKRAPVYLVRDREFIRQITIRDFDHFEDHINFIEPESDSLFGNSLFSMSGKKWHDMRSTLSPAFTGSKMRHMFDLVIECAEDVTKYLTNDAKKGKPVRWEMKELFSRYTIDVIATCGFGLKTNSLQDATNEFYTIGSSILSFRTTEIVLRMLLIRTVPKLMRVINMELFPTKIKQFFRRMVIDTMDEREKKNIFRSDMINILMQVRKGTLKRQTEEADSGDMGFATTEESHIQREHVKRSWTDEELIGQCFVFFAAGFDTASTTLSFLAYEMAINQDIQQKVYEEIQSLNDELNDSRLTYESLSKLKYLDQVISETLRKWPPALFTNRKCTKDYELDYNGQKVLIEQGRALWIPICSIHHDPENYENPGKFDPERFSDENKHKIKAGSYIPFGIGPRNCIGSRFALMNIKAIAFYLLLNFNIQPYEETQIPIKFAKAPAVLTPEKGIHLEFKQRL